MQSQSSIKYLLLSALALAVIVCATYFGRNVRSAGTVSEAALDIEVTPTPTPARSVANQPVASHFLPASAADSTEPVSVERNQPAETLSSVHDNLAVTLKSIETDYVAMAQPILDQSAPIIGTEERTKLAFLDQEKLADVSKVLSIDELEIYQNTTDPAAAPRRR